jgi:hypothetical protein
MVPHVHLLLEAAPFADLGAVGDPDLGGWRRTRQGYGLSLRVVLEPSLVLAFDLALSPGASHPLFYFSGGEAL